MPMNVDEKDVLLMSLTGLVSLDSQEDVVVKGIGLSRGDKRRNKRLARLRVLVPAENAILGIDLADTKQAVVVTDHDSQVLARGPVTAKAWELGPVLDWARKVAHAHGFADVTVGCEPTGHRWRVLDQLAAQHDMALVCVQPLLTGQARQAEDYTSDKRDDKDAVLIARLVAQLHCYAPERAEETWAQLRQLGVRRELPRWGGQRLWRGIVGAVFTTLTDPAGVIAQRRGALQRAGWVLDDWRLIKIRLAEVETQMAAILDELDLTKLVTSIPGVSAVGAAAILAETGDPTRFDSPRALVKHAGLCPRENTSGTYTGRSRISGRGRPRLRSAAWRAVWGALPSNPVMAT